MGPASSSKTTLFTVNSNRVKITALLLRRNHPSGFPAFVMMLLLMQV
jgi:hypothetical protein